MTAGEPRVGLIVVAAGTSRRMEGVDKLWMDLGGAPLLARTLEALARALPRAQAVGVCSAQARPRLEVLRQQSPWSFVCSWVQGGAHRQDSVYAGLCALAACDIVVIHDGARPCVTPEIIARGLRAVLEWGAATAAVPVTDTIKVVDPRTHEVISTPDRSTLWAVQTPQVFAYDVLGHAYATVGAQRTLATDDAGLVERAGHRVTVFAGSPANIKVSTPADMALVRALYHERVQGDGEGDDQRG